MPADDAPDAPAPADPAPAPTNPAQAAEHSTSEPAAPPASSDLADAPRPRRRALGPAFRRAASTGFLLGSLAALLVTVALAVVRYRQMTLTNSLVLNLYLVKSLGKLKLIYTFHALLRTKSESKMLKQSLLTELSSFVKVQICLQLTKL